MYSTCEHEHHPARALKPYPAYKNSSVEWLGKVPANWDVERLKCSLINIVEQADEIPQVNTVVALENVESWTGRVALADSGLMFDSQLKRFRSGDVLFGKLRPYLAKVARLKSNGLCVGEFLVLRPRYGNVMGPYFEHLLRSKPIIDAVTASTYGAKMPRADWGFIGGMPVVRPPLAEQTAIVRFLDHADRRIRRYIQTKEKLIALLEERKQAIIHHAVTGQIDVRTGEPYPSYKVSREEWLAVVPTHWEVRRLKSLVRRIDQGVSPQAENYQADGNAWGVLRAGCVNGGVFRETEHKRLAPDFVFDPVLVVTTGDVLVSRANGSPHLVGSVGRISSLRHKLILSDKTFRPIFNQEIEPNFMVLAMNSRYYRQQVEQAISGAEGLANNLPLSSLRSFHFAVPAFEEQHDIVRYLQESTHKLSAVAARTKREVALLDEYHSRLIADVVTGKLDVREAAAGLPEVGPLATEGDSVDGVDHEVRSERTGWRHAVEEGGPLADVADA